MNLKLNVRKSCCGPLLRTVYSTNRQECKHFDYYSNGDNFDELARCVPPVINSEADFDALPVDMRDNVAETFGRDRNRWPEWLKIRYSVPV